MFGNATLTMNRSSEAMNAATDSTARITPWPASRRAAATTAGTWFAGRTAVMPRPPWDEFGWGFQPDSEHLRGVGWICQPLPRRPTEPGFGVLLRSRSRVGAEAHRDHRDQDQQSEHPQPGHHAHVPVTRAAPSGDAAPTRSRPAAGERSGLSRPTS